MRKIRLPLFVALLVVAAGAGVNEAKQAAKARAETQAMQAQLLQLRGEVVILRDQLAALSANAPRPASLQPAPTGGSASAAVVPMQLAAEIERGDSTALEKLNEYSQKQHASFNAKSAGLEGGQLDAINRQCFEGLRAAFQSLADETTNGNTHAVQAIYQSTGMPYLQGVAVMALGELAGHGDQKALSMLLNPGKHGLLLSGSVRALGPAADSGNEQAIDFLAAVMRDGKNKALWFMASQGLQKANNTGNPVAVAALNAYRQ